MDDTSSAVTLGIQLGIAAGLMLLMTITHSLGILAISKLLRLEGEHLRGRAFDFRAVLSIGSLGLLIFALHIAEIVIFAAFYLWVEALRTFEEALYFSASAYATLGLTTDSFPTDWRLVGAFEALAGFVLIGWSTAFMVSTMKKLSG